VEDRVRLEGLALAAGFVLEEYILALCQADLAD